MAIAALAASYVIVFVANWGNYFERLLPLLDRALTQEAVSREPPVAAALRVRVARADLLR